MRLIATIGATLIAGSLGAAAEAKTYQKRIELSCSLNQCDGTFAKVASDKTLRISTLSCAVLLSAGTSDGTGVLRSFNNPSGFFTNFKVEYISANNAISGVVNTPMTFKSGERPIIVMQFAGGTTADSGSCSLRGTIN